MTPLPPICLTGAGGFIGQRVIERLAALGVSDVTLLRRKQLPLEPRVAAWRSVQVDLTRDTIPPGTIVPGAVVIHLAAATGRAAPRAMHSVNVAGTARLLDAVRKAGGRHFIYVSSIAAGYRDQRWAPYAQTKAAAERLVVAAAIPYMLVRPTMVFGPGSPNQVALERLATLAFPVLPGQGDVRVQPIHVTDVAEALVHLATMPVAASAPVTLGGPTAVTMRELFAAMRRVRGLPPRAPVTLPLEALRRALALLGAVTGSAFPVSAGQLLAFANDSVADAPPAGVYVPAPRFSLDDMLTPRAGT